MVLRHGSASLPPLRHGPVAPHACETTAVHINKKEAHFSVHGRVHPHVWPCYAYPTGPSRAAIGGDPLVAHEMVLCVAPATAWIVAQALASGRTSVFSTRWSSPPDPSCTWTALCGVSSLGGGLPKPHLCSPATVGWHFECLQPGRSHTFAITRARVCLKRKIVRTRNRTY